MVDRSLEEGAGQRILIRHCAATALSAHIIVRGNSVCPLL